MFYMIMGPMKKTGKYIVSRVKGRRGLGRTMTKDNYEAARATAEAMRKRDGRVTTRITFYDCRLPNSNPVR